MVAVTSPRKPTGHSVARALPRVVFENSPPSSSRQISGSTSHWLRRRLPCQEAACRARSSGWPVYRAVPDQSPIAWSTSQTGSRAQMASSSSGSTPSVRARSSARRAMSAGAAEAEVEVSMVPIVPPPEVQRIIIACCTRSVGVPSRPGRAAVRAGRPGEQGRDAVIVYTVGHSTRPIEEFVALLGTYGITRVVDVRTVPKSRHNPQFARDALEASLPAAGIDYVHLAALGGLRHSRKDSPNTGWRNASFRGYADYMQTAEFADGIDRL